MSKIEERIEELVTKPINNLGYDVYDVIYEKEGKDNYLRIFIDNDVGISLDDCEKVNNEIDEILDTANIISSQYFLEVSSPGVERLIRKNKQLEQNLNKEIFVKMFKNINNEKELIGTLKSYNEEFIIILVEQNEIKIDRKNIALMKTTYKW